MKQPITKQQLTILLLLYKFRFLDTPTLQHLLHHKLPTRVQQWLYDLTKKGYIKQFYDRTSFVERTKPAMYCLTTKAKELLKNHKDCNPDVLNTLYREKDRTETFQQHCCFIAQVYIKLVALQQTKTEPETFRFFTKVSLREYDFFPQPLPDAYIALEKKRGKTKRYFLELFDQGIPRRALKRKLERYTENAESGEWEKRESVFPHILLICQNPYEQKKISKLIRQVQDESFSMPSFYILNKDTFASKGFVWEKVES